MNPTTKQTQQDTPADEQRANLSFFFKNGFLMLHSGVGRDLPDLCLGRTDSKLGLGFTLTNRKTGKEQAAFVLDRAQVETLRSYLGRQIGRLKRSRGQTSVLAKLDRLAKRRRRARAKTRITKAAR